MSIYEQIKDSLVKQNKVLQVDFLGSKIIQNSRDYFQQWEHVNPLTKNQLKLWEYLQNEELHQQKYFRFKKAINKKHFGLKLPQKYKNSTILPQKQKQFLYSTRNMALTVLGNNSTMENSGRSFFKGTNSARQRNIRTNQRAATSLYHRSRFQQRKKTSYQPKQKQRDLSRYWPPSESEQIAIQSKDSSQFLDPKKLQHHKHDESIYNNSLKLSINRSFANLEIPPKSRQLSRHASKIKDIVQKTINPASQSQHKRKTIKSMTEKMNMIQKKARQERKSIMSMIQNKQDWMNLFRRSRPIDPKKKGIFTLDDLSDFQKFNLSYSKYMQLKSLRKINNYAYEHKVKSKTTNLQRFQDFIMQQFEIDNDNKRKLQRVFQQIKWEFSKTQRLKQAEKR